MRCLLALILCGVAACHAGAAGVDGGGDGLASAAGSDLAAADGATTPGVDLAIASGPESVRIIVEPGDSGAGLQTAIATASKSVHVTMYLFTNTDLLNALVERHKAGVDVKVVLNKAFPTSSTSNQTAYDTLKTAGVGVVWAPVSFVYTHEKCVIIDGAVAWIMTMNATHTAVTANREYLAVDSQAADVAEAEAIFAADFAGKAWSPGGVLVVSPENSRDRLVTFIGTATSTVDVEDEELSDPKIVAALTSQKDAGRTVRVVLSDSSPSSSQSAAVATLKQHKVPVVVVHTPYIHAKAIVVDGASVFVGSENFTTGSLQFNRELGLILSIATEVKKVADALSTDFGNGTAL